MATRFKDILVHDADCVPEVELWKEELLGRALRPRVLRTTLTNEELMRHGLATFSLNDDLSDARTNDSKQTSTTWLTPEWLVTRAADEAQQIRHYPPTWFVELKDRIANLQSFAKEDRAPFSQESADLALDFAEGLPLASLPSAFAIGNGNIRLLWLNAEDEQVGLHFRPDGIVQFILFRRCRGRIMNLMGTASISEVLDVVASNGLMHVLHG